LKKKKQKMTREEKERKELEPVWIQRLRSVPPHKWPSPFRF